MNTVNVIKIGGNVIDNSEALKKFMQDFAQLKGMKILVHGGGKEATRLSESMGVETKMVDGRRITDRPTLDIVTMVYAGLINKRIVSMLQAEGCNAMGMTGADGDTIPATRRSPNPIDFGYVGDIDSEKINIRLLAGMLEQGCVPVFCAICHDGKGTLLNCNADTVAASLAIALSAAMPTRLTYCFEKPGVMTDVDDEDSIIPVVTPALFQDLKAQGVIAAGMIPKLQNALECAAKGVREVRICSSEAISSAGGTIIINHE